MPKQCSSRMGIAEKGPVYVAMFKPLSIAIEVTMGVMFLGDTLHLGSVIGAIIISLGFYTVMWGKAKEEIAEDNEVGSAQTPATICVTQKPRKVKYFPLP
ncbi:hypothetical protein QYF36_005535 [Acer negundo]|nr:hypothetical protein QYF36_005535 [Acer negundo]